MPDTMGGPAGGSKKQVSIGGGMQPAGRTDGKEIFYLTSDGKMMSVPVEWGAAGPKLDVPKPLFQTQLDPMIVGPRQYDVSADGKRFLLAQPLEESASVPITVITNWTALIKR
jgi:hypothetical protein